MVGLIRKIILLLLIVLYYNFWPYLYVLVLGSTGMLLGHFQAAQRIDLFGSNIGEYHVQNVRFLILIFLLKLVF